MKTSIIYEAPQILIDFLGYMQTVKGKSPKTVDEYYININLIFEKKSIYQSVDHKVPFNKLGTSFFNIL